MHFVLKSNYQKKTIKNENITQYIIKGNNYSDTVIIDYNKRTGLVSTQTHDAKISINDFINGSIAKRYIHQILI